MVAINKEQEVGKKTDVVCPKCFKTLNGCAILPAVCDRYGRTTRTYFGWCNECKCGFEGVQFEKDGRWIIHKHRPYGIRSRDIHYEPIDDFVTLNELPEPAPVVVGSGGDYDEQVELKNTEILKSLQKTLIKTGELLRQLLTIRTGENQ